MSVNRSYRGPIVASVSVLVLAAVALLVVLVARPASGSSLGSFGWIKASAPTTWTRVAVPAGLGTVAEPTGFRMVKTDPGTVSLAMVDSAGTFVGYLNVTPRQGSESLGDWADFRIDHLRDDGTVSVHEDATIQSVKRGSVVRSCVVDDYVTTVGHHPFHEVACFVTGSFPSSVVVASVPVGDPAHLWTELQEAVASYPTAA
jgi:hypothetical protein